LLLDGAEVALSTEKGEVFGIKKFANLAANKAIIEKQ
jgi:hypothetical protein